MEHIQKQKTAAAQHKPPGNQMKLPIAAAIFSMMMFQTNANAFWLDIVKEFVAGGIKSVVMPKKIIDESSNPNPNPRPPIPPCCEENRKLLPRDRTLRELR